MARNEINGKITTVKTSIGRAKAETPFALMSAREIRRRIGKGFPALTIEMQDAVVRMMEASLAKIRSTTKRSEKQR